MPEGTESVAVTLKSVLIVYEIVNAQPTARRIAIPPGLYQGKIVQLFEKAIGADIIWLILTYGTEEFGIDQFDIESRLVKTADGYVSRY